MREIVIDETMQDMDKDKDGYITLQEYISEWVWVWGVCDCVWEGGRVHVIKLIRYS